ncbi:MAG TPA: helix-turn-helix domain-containing protein [Gaiellaceae bacterium]|nr:helix-turn-helix domain-containing protein [Gaiellaceae bacterium]
MDRLDALGDAALRSTVLFVRAARRPVTADDVASRLDVSRSVARWRLERLVNAGLVTVGFERRSGRTGPGAGRPAKTYAAAPETSAVEFPPRHYEALVGGLVGALPRRGRAKHLDEVGYAFGLELGRAARLRPAATFRASLDRLCRGLGRLGFQASVESADDDRAVIVSATCPLRPVVVSDPDARSLDSGMWRGLLAAAAGGNAAARARCSTRDCLDAMAPCRIVVERSR